MDAKSRLHFYRNTPLANVLRNKNHHFSNNNNHNSEYTGNRAAVVFGISGANNAEPFDASYLTSTGTAAPTSLSLKTSTANANDFIIGTFGVEYTYTGTNDIGFAGTSTSLIQWKKATSSRLILDDYKIVSSKRKPTST